jgi:hypothetical protein
MGRSKRSSPQGADRAEQWLGADHAPRSRPWAYHELLFESETAAESARELRSLADDLAVDLAELKRMQNELHDQVVRIAQLEGRIQTLLRSTEAGAAARPDGRAPDAEMRSFPSDGSRSRVTRERGRSLARCEGFQVESSTGTVGFVEGLRFASRIDVPDLLEVRGGRFGRELMLIPIEAVEEISPEEERLVVRGLPRVHDDYAHELVSRLRRVLHHPAS